MSVNIFQIGISGLQAAQIGLAVTGQNITNATTAGYSLQKVQQISSPGQGYNFGFLGTGVEITSVTRQYNDMLGKQISSLCSNYSQLETYSNLITPINNVIADPAAGLSPVLQSFFSSLQSLSSNPSDLPSLQSSLSSAQTLVSQFQALQNQFNQAAATVNSQVSASVSNINTYAQELASLNSAIQIAYTTTNQPPNTLLDQRDELVKKLSQETQVTVVPEGNQYNVFIGVGQPLVMGSTANSLQTVQSTTNPAYLDIAFSSNGKLIPINEADLPGGALAGAFAFRATSLSPIQNSLGQVAIVLASALNAQNKLGQTINGTMGKDLFTIATPVVNGNSSNTGNAQINAAITDPSALNTHNYSLSYDGTNYTITDIKTNTVMSTFSSFPATPTEGVNVINGVTFTLAGGSMAPGDTFQILPTVGGAAGFNLLSLDPTQFATAAPIATSPGKTNTGNGVMTPGSVSTGFTPGAVSPPTTLSYDAASNSLSGFPAGSTIVVTVNGVETTYANYVPGTEIPYTSGMTMSFNNMTVGLSGAPADCDTFAIGPNTDGKGDNRNMLLMSALLTQNTMNNGTTTFQGAYSQLVSMVGNTTSQLLTTGTTEANLLKAALQQQQSESGVNLDQETVNLIQYQQAYQASGEVIRMAKEFFSDILQLVQ